MSIYAVNKVLFRVSHDPELRRALAGSDDDRRRALEAATPPLSEEERDALMAGDVGRLSRMGGIHFLLHQLGRWNLLGIDLQTYSDRIRAEYRTERVAWGLTAPGPSPAASDQGPARAGGTS